MRYIPRTAFFYWGAPVLPYLRYMCLVSFKMMNPDWRVVLFTPAKLTTEVPWGTCEQKIPVKTRDYMPELLDLKFPNVDICPFDMEEIGFSNSLPEVIKSDIIRLYLLSEHGGLWADTDILFFRPIQHALPTDDSQAYFCYRRGGPSQDPTPKNGPEYHCIGFLLGARHNPYYTKLFAGVRNTMNVEAYQSCGSPYYRKMINISDPGIHNLDINIVYPSRAIPGMWKEPTRDYVKQIWSNCIGWHWYGGHPWSGDLQNRILHDTYTKFDNVITWILGRLLRGEKI